MPSKSVKPRSFWEPWQPRKSVLHGKAPNVEGVPEDAAALMMDAWERIDRDADWVLWGSRMAEPAIGTSYVSGKPYVMNDERIIAVRRWLGMPKESPTHQEVAERIANCVNAMAGIGDPMRFIDDVRELLLALAREGCTTDPRTDPRVVGLLGRCVPPKKDEL